jgi:hypothetical protein
MADSRLTIIKKALSTTLASINGTAQPSGYVQHTKTGTVGVKDTAKAEAIAKDAGVTHGVHYLIRKDEDDGETVEDISYGFDSYRNLVRYDITARVSNLGTEDEPEEAIEARISDVISDVKQNLWENDTLGGEVFSIVVRRSTDTYSKTANSIFAGTVIIETLIEYGQAGSNPDLKACES